MNDIQQQPNGMWACPECTAEWSSPMAAVACMEDDVARIDRGRD